MISTPTLQPIDHQRRTYTSFPGATYLLPADDSERIRFDTQHKSITRGFNNKLVLSSVTLKDGDKVLDSGAGSCSWLLDFAPTVSADIEFYASDVETRLFPVHPPRNVKLFKASVTDLPKEWSGSFQLIHQRLLMSALTSEEWPTAIGELYRVTKPGGWVELCEASPQIDCPSHPDHKAIRTPEVAYEASDHVIQAAALLPQWLRNTGFTDIHSVEGKFPIGKWAGPDGVYARDGLIGFFRALKTPILSRGGLGFAKSEAEFDGIINDFEHIVDETPNTFGRNYTIYARKPGSVA
ncbi:S-adenosyl-L-methionine-dependent methyltransferase [Macrolepiota fuliginosa MF-IS2]|uniref:S-adenosyl-L-methionine-dependent methyltransferase n=1 Tax=Macrolepiota fuliginosa MF-IS2 TaxID=1400762 RepID=A0A9P5XKD4_9AGAR|nr:S-adenosyl-L-methionine-dependent methyltransferase [Macrolepiota fuliginosa MF-IS2]